MIKIELSEAHFNTIVELLTGAPYRVAAPLLAELSRQMQEQRAEPPAGTPASPRPPNGGKRATAVGT